MRSGSRAGRGFTLIELIVVLSIVALLVAIAGPRYFRSVERSREATLQHNLRILREAIDRFAADTGRYPESLDELARRRYVSRVPVDPLTDTAGSWVVVPPPQGLDGRVYDVRSGAEGVSSGGQPYASM